MKHIHNRLLFWFLILSICPTMFIGIFSYYRSAKSLQEKLNRSSLSILEQINKNVDEKVEKVNKYMDVFFTNDRIQKILTEVNFRRPTGITYMAYYELDPMIGSLFYKDMDVQAAALFSNVGGNYIYKGYISQDEDIRSYEWYQMIEENKGQTLWVGLIPNPNQLSNDKNVFAVGRVIKDIAFRRTMGGIGIGVVFLNQNIFSDIYGDVKVGANDVIVLIDAQGKIVSQERDGNIEDIWHHALTDEILTKDQGYFRKKIDKKDMMITYSTSPVTGWKTIRMIPYRYYINEIRDIGWITFALLIISLMAIYLISYLIARRISQPIRNLSYAMGRVSQEDFHVSVPVLSNDEVGLISDGFNHMVENLRNQFNRVIQEERQKRQAQIRALQYQINPHFLYNTLASIRMVAMMHHDDEVAHMILVLNRLLRKTISKAGHMITVAEEFDNLKDYFTLQQVRYKNRLIIEYEVEEEVLSCKVPGMLLQPLAENAIIHGLSDKLNQGKSDAKIIIKGALNGEALLLEIEDNGRGIPESYIDELTRGEEDRIKEKGIQIGIKNTHDRIRLEFGNEYGITLKSDPDKYTRITVKLPAIIGGDEKNDQHIIGR